MTNFVQVYSGVFIILGFGEVDEESVSRHFTLVSS